MIRIRAKAGFTLLELVVVLAVIGLATAMALPSTMKMWRRHQSDAVVLAVEQHIVELPFLAREQSQILRWERQDAAAFAQMLQLPEGWRLEIAEPIRVEASGYCWGGRVVLTDATTDVALKIAAPFCRTRRES